jgi:mono/diheme cytochrome c family protein
MCCLRPSTFRTVLLALGLLALAATGCDEIGMLPADGDRPFAPLVAVEGMHIQPSFKDQDYHPNFGDEPLGMRLPPPMTVPVDGVTRDPFASPDDAAEWQNPVPITMDSLQYGKFLYDTHCSVCHGTLGHGDGPVIAAGFGAPPTLNSDKLRAQEDGRIYHVITYGQNAMGPYRNQLNELERWAVVNYVRALQRADLPEPIDLDRMRAIGQADPTPPTDD